MPNFKYKAVTPDGQVLSSTLTAPDEKEAIQQLKKMNLVPVHVALETTRKLERSLSTKIKRKYVLLFTKQLYTLLRAGIPILACLEAIKEQNPDQNFRAMIETISKEVEQGNAFSEALAQFPKIFPPIYVNSVKVGEVSGTLEETLLYLHKYLEEEDRIRQNLKKALRYPALVVSGIILAFLVFTTVVIPNFIPIFEMSQTTLPLPTRILMAVYHLLTGFGLYLMILVVASAVGLYLYVRTEKGRYQKDKILLQMPILGNLLQKILISRFAKIFYTLNHTGIPVITAFQVMQETIENSVYKKEIEKIADKIKKGESIAKAVKESPYFSNFMVEMISIGERSGSLDEMLDSVSQYYDLEVNEAVNNMTAMIEPIVTVVLGGMVLLLAMAIFLPIWDMMSVIQK